MRCSNYFASAFFSPLFEVGFEDTYTDCSEVADTIEGTTPVVSGSLGSGDCNFVGAGVVEGDQAARVTGDLSLDYVGANTDPDERWMTWAAYYDTAATGNHGLFRTLSAVGAVTNPRVRAAANGAITLVCDDSNKATGLTIKTNEQSWLKLYSDGVTADLTLWDETDGLVGNWSGACTEASDSIGLRLTSDNAGAAGIVFDAYQLWDSDPGDPRNWLPARNNQSVPVVTALSDTNVQLDGSGSTCQGTCTYQWAQTVGTACVIADDTALSTGATGCTPSEAVTFQLSVSSEWPKSTASDNATLLPPGSGSVFPCAFGSCAFD
jgi:hypothetical protein